jgi:hypothetical protein
VKMELHVNGMISDHSIVSSRSATISEELGDGLGCGFSSFGLSGCNEVLIATIMAVLMVCA